MSTPPPPPVPVQLPPPRVTSSISTEEDDDLPAVPTAYEDAEGEYESPTPSGRPIIRDDDIIEFTRAQKKISDLEIVVESAIRKVDLWFSSGTTAAILFLVILGVGTSDAIRFREELLPFYVSFAILICWFVAWAVQESHPLFFKPFEIRKWDGIENRARKEDERIDQMSDDDITSVMESVLGPRKYEEKRSKKKEDKQPKSLKRLKKMKGTK